MHYRQLQSTPDNSNLQGKSKTVRVIGSSKQITSSEEMVWGRNASIMYTSLQGQQEIYLYFEKEIEQQSLH